MKQKTDVGRKSKRYLQFSNINKLLSNKLGQVRQITRIQSHTQSLVAKFIQSHGNSTEIWQPAPIHSNETLYMDYHSQIGRLQCKSLQKAICTWSACNNTTVNTETYLRDDYWRECKSMKSVGSTILQMPGK